MVGERVDKVIKKMEVPCKGDFTAGEGFGAPRVRSPIVHFFYLSCMICGIFLAIIILGSQISRLEEKIEGVSYELKLLRAEIEEKQSEGKER